MPLSRGDASRRLVFRPRSWRPAALVAVLGLDAIKAILRRDRLDRPTVAVLDESAHLLTALTVLDALGVPRRTPFWWSAVAASVLIDVDHIPAEFGYRFLTRGVPRP